MAKSFRPVERDQGFLLPPDMREWLQPGHLAWFLIDVVGELDLTSLVCKRSLGGAGRSAYDPRMLATLLLYAYATKVRSSREIERLCQIDVAYRVICAQDAPDHSTISRFRAEHEDTLTTLFDQVLVLCARAGLVRLGTVALDGTKIAANASLGANRSEKWLRKQVEEMFAEAAATDTAEDALFGDARGDELPAELADPRGRKHRLRRALDELAAEREQAEHADTEQAKREAARPNRNVERAERRVTQAETDLDQALSAARRRHVDMQARREQAHAAGIAYCGPRNPKPPEDYADVRRATQRLERARANAERVRAERDQKLQARAERRTQARHDQHATARRNITDLDSRPLPTRNQGWLQGYNAQAVVSADQIVLATDVTSTPSDTVSFVPMMRAAEHAAHLLTTATGANYQIGTLLADAGYDSLDNLTAAGPDRLIADTTSHKLRAAARETPTDPAPPPDASPRERMNHRLRTPDGHTLYAQRAHTVEPIFGHAKEQRGFRRFSRRGLTAAASEWTLIATVHNLLKLHQARTT